MRIDDRLIVTVPGETTAETGRRIRAAVLGAAGPLVRRVVISGLANDYVHYFTTPEEYERQHYEGGATQFGPASSVALTDSLVELAGRMRDGRPAPAPYPYDPTNGVSPDGPPYGPGAERGSLTGEPAGLRRLERTEVSWHGGERGLDRPLDRAFVTVERLVGRRWRPYTSDLGLQILWSVDDGAYRAQWEAPLDAPARPLPLRHHRQPLPAHIASVPVGALGGAPPPDRLVPRRPGGHRARLPGRRLRDRLHLPPAQRRGPDQVRPPAGAPRP